MDTFLEQTPIGRGMVLKKSLESLNEKTKGKFIGHYKALESVMFAQQSQSNLPAAYDREAQLFSDLLVSPEAKNQIALASWTMNWRRLARQDKIPR